MESSLYLAFITGLTSGGVSCLAVQGGLLTSALSSQKNSQNIPEVPHQSNWKFVATFLATKLLAYTIVGGLLGALGSFFTISLHAQGYLQILVGIFMIVTVARILDLHPFFRRFVIAPPRFMYRRMRLLSQDSSNLTTAALLGLCTVFLPCGITQLMMAGAVASGSFVTGSLLLFAFTLGTSPVFFLLGTVSSQLLKRPVFTHIASLVVLFFGVTSLNGGLTLVGFPYTLTNLYTAATTDIGTKVASAQAEVKNGKQELTLTVSSHAYTPSATVLKAGIPVKLSIKTDNAQGCIRAFTIPSLNMTKLLPETGEETMEFTPQTPGKLAFSCNMGMYSGEFDVIL